MVTSPRHVSLRYSTDRRVSSRPCAQQVNTRGSSASTTGRAISADSAFGQGRRALAVDPHDEARTARNASEEALGRARREPPAIPTPKRHNTMLVRNARFSTPSRLAGRADAVT